MMRAGRIRGHVLQRGRALAAATNAAPTQQEGALRRRSGMQTWSASLDPVLPRHVVRHELSGSDRLCAHDGSTLVEIGVEASEQLDIIPQQVRVIRHERVNRLPVLR